MENEVLKQVLDFLKELRCTNMQRESLVRLESCNTEKKLLQEMKIGYYEVVNQCNKEQRMIMEQYVEQLKAVSFEEQQEAYCQGLVDAVQILAGLHLLAGSKPVEFFQKNK